MSELKISSNREDVMNAAIGSFVIEFELMNYYVKSIIISLLEKQGLKNPRLAFILLYDTTAHPLMKYFEGFISELYKKELEDIELKKYFRKLTTNIQAAAELRNDFLHATWFFGYNKNDIEQNDFAIGIRDKVGKEGLIEFGRDYTASDFKDASLEVKLIREELRNLLENIDGDVFIGKDINVGKLKSLKLKLKEKR